MIKQTQTKQETGMASDLMAWVEYVVEGWLFRRSNMGRVVAAGRR